MGQRIEKSSKILQIQKQVKRFKQSLWKQSRFNYFINTNLSIIELKYKCLLYTFSRCFLEPEWSELTSHIIKTLSYWWELSNLIY